MGDKGRVGWGLKGGLGGGVAKGCDRCGGG